MRQQTTSAALRREGTSLASRTRSHPGGPGSDAQATGPMSERGSRVGMTSRKTTFAVIGMCVLALHGAALWALQFGLTPDRHDSLVPIHLQAQLIEPPRPIVPPPQEPVVRHAVVPKPRPPGPQPLTPRVARPGSAPTRNPVAQPGPKPVQPAEPVIALAVTAASTAQSVAGPATPPATPDDTATAPGLATATNTNTAMAAAVPAPALSAPAPAIEWPSSDAHYLQNPRPPYPPLSRRLREQGTVLVDVLVSDRGLASQARVNTSSGFFRLDNAAVSTVLTWRFVPGKRAGIAQSMWFTVPIVFAIQ